MGSDFPGALGRVARYQSGIVARGQAIKHGLSASTIKSKIASGSWRPIYRGVYATFTGPLNRRAQLWAAVLYAGPGAVLSHETAAELQGLVDRPSRVTHITIPPHRRVRAAPGMMLHISARVRQLRFPPGELPRTWVEDTILDLAEAADDSDAVCGWVTRAFGRRLTAEGPMRATMAQRRRQRWRSELDGIIAAAAGGAHSVLEFRYDRDVERAHGLPASRHQVPFTKADGRKGFRDRLYEEYQVVVELDGKEAHPDDERWRDKARDNAAAADGQQSLRYGWREVRWGKCQTAIQVAAVLRRRGWQGAPAPCSPACPVAESGGGT